eukprot:1931577-Rhodomonas_salina.3
MRERESAKLNSHALSMFFLASTIFGVKSIVLLVYSTAPGEHVAVYENVTGLSLLIVSAAYWVITSILQATAASDYLHAECTNAYVVFVCAMFLSSITMLLECRDKNSVLCRYQYPFSFPAGIETGLHVGMMSLFFLLTVSYASSVKWNRPFFLKSFLWTGLFLVVVCNILMVYTAFLGAVTSCGRDVPLTQVTTVGKNTTYVVVITISLLGMLAPFILKEFTSLLGVGNDQKPKGIVWNNIHKWGSDGVNIISVALILGGMGTTFVILILGVNDSQFHGLNIWIHIISMGLGVSWPVYSWFIVQPVSFVMGKSEASYPPFPLRYTRGVAHKHV